MKFPAIAVSVIGLSIAMLTGCATNATNEPSAEAPAANTSSEQATSTSSGATSESTGTGAGYAGTQYGLPFGTGGDPPRRLSD